MSWLRRMAEAPLWAMLWKELVQLRRDRMTLGMMLGIPAIQLALFGYAIRTEVRHLPTVVLDESRSSESRRLVEVFRNSGNFDIVAHVADRAALASAIETGRASAALVIPPEFMRDIRRGRPAEAQVIVDAADPLASSAALSSAQLASAARAAEIAGAGPSRLDVRVRPWYNPGLRSPVYIVPGIIGVLLSLTLVLITSMRIREAPWRRRAAASARRASRSSACALSTVSKASRSAFFSGVVWGVWLINTVPVSNRLPCDSLSSEPSR